MAAPVLYLHSWGWVAARVKKREWPPEGYSGRAYRIMAYARTFELGDGCVAMLAPSTPEELSLLRIIVRRRRAFQDCAEEAAAYRALLEARWLAGLGAVAPGQLLVASPTPTGADLVGSGDALCCACSAADAAAGRCHRAWAAPLLARVGWTVFLDGQAVPVPTTGGA